MDEPTRIVAVRHGRTAWNAEQRLQGHMDVALDALGRAQAARLAQALYGEDLAAVYSSDLQRARDTAAPLAAAAGLVVQTDAALRERCFGHLEGLTHAEVERDWPDDARCSRLRHPDCRPGGGESLSEFYARTVTAVSAIASRHAGQAIAIVAHGGVLDCLYRAAMHVALQAPRSWQLGNASINRLLHHGEGLVVVGWNYDAHLAGLDETHAAHHSA
jgi:probable phosphoglycerate mutase